MVLSSQLWGYFGYHVKGDESWEDHVAQVHSPSLLPQLFCSLWNCIAH